MAWEFPGGKQEAGETIGACIDRELMEELGITVQVGEELITVDHAYSHKSCGLWCISAHGSRRPPALASQQVRWVRPESLNNYPFPAANARIIAALLDRLGAQEASI